MKCTTNTRLFNVIALTSLLLASVLAGMDQSTKDYILKVHNDYRAGEGASNMPKLEWDGALEKEAEAWARNCVFKHKGMGENLAWNSAVSKPQNQLIDKAMKAFFDEKLRYSYGQPSCGTSNACHYTQLVWAETTRVGCATHTCTPLTNGYKKAWYLVCRYDPPGNWVGEKPFQKGSACSGCNGGACDKGLCVSSSKKRATECQDLKDDCMDRAQKGECWESGNDYVSTNCKLTCDLC